MNNIQYYKGKSDSILSSLMSIIDPVKEFDSVLSHMKNPGEYPISDLELEFKHLVYAFDPNLPLNSYLKDTMFPYGFFPKKEKLNTFIRLIHFFQNYLIEFGNQHPDSSED